MIYTRPEVIPLRRGQNYAPLKPLLQLGQEKQQTHFLQDALKERYKHFWEHEKLTWRELISAGELVAHMVTGDALPERNPWTGGWLAVRPTRQDASTSRALNFMQFYFTNCIVKWMQSNPDVIARAARDDDRSAMAAKAADIIVDHYELKFFKPWFNYAEALNTLCFGTYIERVRHDSGIKGVIGIREIVENRTIQIGDGWAYCGDCGASGTAAQFQPHMEPDADDFGGPPDGDMDDMHAPGVAGICPQCGSESVLMEPAPMDTVPSVVGQEQVEMGDLVCESLLFPGCRWDLRTRAEWSPWFLYQQKIPLGAVRRLLGNVRIPGQPEGLIDIGAQVIRALAYSGQAVSGRAYQPWRNPASKEDPTLCEMWLSPQDYADIVIKGNEETVGGEPLPQGASLEQLFPDGLCAVGLNGFNVVLGLYAERHADHLTSGVWHMKPMSGAGRGQQDLVEVQKRYNKLDSQQLAFMDATATPAILHDKDLLDDDEAQYLGSPRANIPVDLSNLPEGHKLGDAIYRMAPESVPGQMVQYTQQFLATAFSTLSHVTDFSNGGISGQSNDTARAAMIADANANSVFGPLLAIKGETRQRIAEMVVQQYREHFPLKRYFPLGGQYSQQPGQWLSAADLSADIRFETVRESELPQNSLSRQDRIVNFFATFGGWEGYMAARQAAPELVAELSQLWNAGIQSNGIDTSAQLSRRRLEQMKAGLQGLQPMAQPGATPGQQPVIDPATLVNFIQPPISIGEKDQEGKRNWFQVWLDTDEGQESPLELRAAVEMVIEIHYNLAGMQMNAIAAQQGQAQGVSGEASGENEMKREQMKNAQKKEKNV